MTLTGKRILIFVADQYQELEVWYPRLRLIEEGASVTVAGLGASSYAGKRGYPITVDSNVEDCLSADFDAVVIPGGWAPDALRSSEKVLSLVREMDATGKVVAAICHAGWVIASAGIVNGKRVTSYHAIKDDLIHAGADWVDEEVVSDGRLVTSRKPDDLPAFCREIIRLLSSA